MKGAISIKAMVLGFLADVVGSMVFSIAFPLLLAIILAATGYSGDQLEPRLLEVVQSGPYIMLSLITGLGFTMLGGYVAGRLARSGEYFHSGGVGLLNILFGLFIIRHFTAWYNILAFALVFPAAVMGGHLAKKKKRALPPERPSVSDLH